VPDLAGETLDPVKDGPVDHKGGTDAAVSYSKTRSATSEPRLLCTRPPIRPAHVVHIDRGAVVDRAQPFADVHVPPTEVGREHQNAGHGIDQCRTHTPIAVTLRLFTECFENRRPAASATDASIVSGDSCGVTTSAWATSMPMASARTTVVISTPM